MQHNLSKKEQDLVTIALPRAEKIMERHIRLPDLNKIPPGSLSGGINGEELELEVRKKRLVYRSKPCPTTRHQSHFTFET